MNWTHSGPVLLHRRGENARFKLTTPVLSTFPQWPVHFLCTGAAVFNFPHKRGGFAKPFNTIVPVHENRCSAKLSNTGNNLPMLTETIGTSRTVASLVLIRGPGIVTDAFFGAFSDMF